MADEKDKQEEALEILEVGADGKPVKTPPTSGSDTLAAAGGDGASATPGGADEDDDDLDERVALTEEDRAARKEERKLRAERRRELNRRRELELVDLRRKNEEYERRLAVVEGTQSRVNVALLNDKLGIAEQQLRQAESLFTNAMANAAKDPGKVTEALRIRDAARDQHLRLVALKERVGAGQSSESGRGAGHSAEERPAELPATVRERVDAFTRKHTWYRLDGKDDDHKMMQALDQQVADAGYDPATSAYWDELEKRAARYLPHRFKTAAGNGAANGARQGPPVAGSGAASAAASGKRVVKVTPERRKAMEEAGAWDDPAKRQKYLKAYEKYDREHAGDAR